jgi:hypothetical protein
MFKASKTEALLQKKVPIDVGAARQEIQTMWGMKD